MKKIFLIVFLLTIQLTQAQTVQQVRDLISSNLATGSKITAEKHREVENAIVSLIENKKEFLHKGTFYLGDIGTDENRLVSFPTIGTNNYLVLGSLVSNGTWNTDNDAFWTVKDKTQTGFNLLTRLVSEGQQNLSFNYVIVPY